MWLRIINRTLGGFFHSTPVNFIEDIYVDIKSFYQWYILCNKTWDIKIKTGPITSRSWPLPYQHWAIRIQTNFMSLSFDIKNCAREMNMELILKNLVHPTNICNNPILVCFWMISLSVLEATASSTIGSNKLVNQQSG